ncbi:ATP-binding protein [Nostoc sp. UHCC 0251]|uniref:ATP-binding protein n=1 Tax=Nostoc sp. UHCC 0251 TaxID=3110240 RepID=UPI002B20148B|nr:ATP-binding protein [Nostoc sp. UHCC 0251]MEA5624759.1 ATP-binding protein [Nostoc sp. UHCC 0251]
MDLNLNGSSGNNINLLTQFKEYAVLHPQLARVDMLLMRAIREPAGFAHVLVYGPSGVGKTTMIRQIARRLNAPHSEDLAKNSSSYRNGYVPQLPLLLIETRPPDSGVFNRTDYYRTALKLLDEPFYERRSIVDIDTSEAWEKKGRGRSSKTSQFNDSPELRHALEEAMTKRGVRAVILDEAQHLMKIGTGSNSGKLLDQLDWIKSMTNVTGVLHILIGTYELLNFRNLSGQASRRGLDIHFPRYLYQNEQDRLDFQAALLALLKQVPLDINIPELMQHWLYFYEHSIGCLGVLKDWLIRTVAAVLDDGNKALTLKQLHEHTLTLAQCERMAIEATEGEQKLSYMESRREHLWHLLQIGMGSTDVPTNAVTPETPLVGSEITSSKTESPPKTKRTRKKPNVPAPQEFTTTTANEIPVEPAPKKKQTRKKTTSTQTLEITETPLSNSSADLQAITPDTQQQTDKSREKKSGTRVGQRKPKRDTVGHESQSTT